MLLRDTLRSVLASPGAPEAADDEVRRLSRPAWPRGLPSHALVLTGVRRSGKSTLQRQIRREHGGASVALNLEDTRLFGLGAADFATVLSILDTEHPRASVYLDEVQEVPEWPRLVRALLDVGRRVCVTGSTASLLGRELGSKLTGRHLPHEVYPVLVPGVPGAHRAGAERRLARGSPAARQASRGALRAGPGPEPSCCASSCATSSTATSSPAASLRSARPLMTLALHLLAAPRAAAHALQALAKGLGLPSGGPDRPPGGVPAGRLARAGRCRASAPPSGVASRARRSTTPWTRASPPPAARTRRPISAGSSRTPCCSALRRRGASPAFAAAPHEWECDFVTEDLAIQCCARLTPENRERELRGLHRAADLPGRAGKRDLLVVTLDQEDSLTEDGRRIRVVPAWKWLD